MSWQRFRGRANLGSAVRTSTKRPFSIGREDVLEDTAVADCAVRKRRRRMAVVMESMIVVGGREWSNRHVTL